MDGDDQQCSGMSMKVLSGAGGLTLGRNQTDVYWLT